MSDRSDFYFEQNVTQSELDQAFDDLENADRNIIADQNEAGGVPNGGIWGVLTGLEVTERTGTPDLNVEIADGVAYDEVGQRIPHSGGPTLLNLATHVPGSDSRYVRIYAAFTRVLSDPRTDGLGTPIDYRQAEGVAFSADPGAIAASPTKPAILSGKVLLATVLLTTGQTQIVDANISMALASSLLTTPDRQEGGIVGVHGRLNSVSRPLRFENSLSGQEVIHLGGKNHLTLDGGTIRMSPLGTENGNAIFMERGQICRAEVVRAEGPPSGGGQGFCYVDQASVSEYGDNLEVTKYYNYDATHFCPMKDSAQVSPWVGGPNSWYLDSPGPLPIATYDAYWRMTFDTPGAIWNVGLACPIVGIPMQCKLVSVEFGVDVVSIVSGLEFGVGVYRRPRALANTDLINAGGVVTMQAMPSTGEVWFAPDAIDTSSLRDIMYTGSYAYYAVLFVYSSTAQTSQDIGIRVSCCRVTTKILEASGIYRA